MFILHSNVKGDLSRQWALPDRLFFAAGACHILAHTFIQGASTKSWQAIWFKPAKGYTGNHIVAVAGNAAFDYHGLTDWTRLRAHYTSRAERRWPGWRADLIALPTEVLVSTPLSKTFDGLWLREPSQYLHDPIPRATRYIAHCLNRTPPKQSIV